MALKKPGGVKNFGAKNETFLTTRDKVKKAALNRKDEFPAFAIKSETRMTTY